MLRWRSSSSTNRCRKSRQRTAICHFSLVICHLTAPGSGYVGDLAVAQPESIAAIGGLRRKQDAVSSLQPAHRAAPPQHMERQLRHPIQQRGGPENASVGRSGYLAEAEVPRRGPRGAGTDGPRRGEFRYGGTQNLRLRLRRDRASGEADGEQLLASLLEEGKTARFMEDAAVAPARRY